MIKFPIFDNKKAKILKYSDQKYIKKKPFLTKENKNKKSHSFIFNYSGLNNVLCKYNSFKAENKNSANENRYLTNVQFQNDKKSMINNDKNSCLTKLKEMNSDMDLLLTGIKSNLEGSSLNTENKNVNIYIFNQINNKNIKNIKYDHQKKDVINHNSFAYLKYSFSFMKICNFNFEIINKKEHYINIEDLSENSKVKLEYIHDNKLNNKQLNIESIIDSLYVYKNKVKEKKIANKSIISKYFINDNGFKKELDKYFEINNINEQNKKLHNEIEFLTEKLTYSFYKGELLLNKYYNKLKQMDINIKKNIKNINNNNVEE